MGIAGFKEHLGKKEELLSTKKKSQRWKARAMKTEGRDGV